MSPKLSSGAILCSQFTSSSDMGGMFSMNGITVGQIVETLYLDHPRNRSKRFVEYDVLVSEDKQTTTMFSNCRTFDSYGDENNFGERVLQDTTHGKRGKKDGTEEDTYKNGAIVLIGCIDGLKESGLILMCLQHSAIRNDSNTNKTPVFKGEGSSTSRDDALKELPTLLPGASSAGENGGQRILGEFQGLRWNINKDGELTIIYQGPKNPDGKLTKPSVQPTTLKINKDGEFFIIDNLDQEIKISRKDQKIIISDGKQDPNSVVIDRANDQINVSASKVVVSGDTVQVGGKEAKESAVLGDVFLKLFNSLVEKFNNHTHDETQPAAPGNFSGPSDKSANKMKKEQHLSSNVKVDKNPTGKVPIKS